MKQIGTVLPTVKSLKASDDFARKLQKEQQKVARSLKKYTRVQKCGETRYYDEDKFFAVIGRDLKIKWFEVREDGDYAVKR